MERAAVAGIGDRVTAQGWSSRRENTRRFSGQEQKQCCRQDGGKGKNIGELAEFERREGRRHVTVVCVVKVGGGRKVVFEMYRSGICLVRISCVRGVQAHTQAQRQQQGRDEPKSTALPVWD